MADRTTADATNHVSTPLVAGLDAVGHGEAAGTDVVGDHLERRALRIDIFGTGLFNGLLRSTHQILEEINIVVGVDLLQNGCQTFQAHAGIDVGLGQTVHVACRVAVKLRKHQVPDFHVTIAVFVGASRRAALNLGATVKEDFRARTAGAGVAHHPEIVGHVAGTLIVSDAHNALRRHADFFVPDVVGFVVFDIDRHPEAFGRKLVNLREQFPGPGNGFTLEIVAEAEIAEHFKKRVVTSRVPDIVQVVVLAAGADALLSRRCTLQALIQTQEIILELVHPRVGKQQRRVVLRDHGARSHNGVSLALEELQKSRTNLGGRHVCVGFHRDMCESYPIVVQPGFAGTTNPRVLHPQQFGEFYRKGKRRK